MVWRLVLCLFGHLTLLFVLAIYLAYSLNSVRLYTPLANAEEVQLESLNTIPALLGAMDEARRDYQKNGDPRDLTLYSQMRESVESNFKLLNTPVILPSEEETKRRELAKKWITEIGDIGITQPKTKARTLVALNAASGGLLNQIHDVTEKVRTEEQAKLDSLREQEASEANGRVSLMWILVLSVTVFTIILQLAMANSIIGPIQSLTAVVRRLQRGDYTARAKIRSGDEIQSLGDTFNAMAENIVHTQKELREKNERLSLQQEALRDANASLEMRVNLKTRELEDKNQKLNEAARLKDEFLATLSHELRTPLTPIITCTHLLTADMKLGPEETKSVQVIDRNARALSRMIDELLDLSIVTNRKLRLVRERTEMNEWTHATIETVRGEWERKGLTVTFIPSEQPVELEIDRL